MNADACAYLAALSCRAWKHCLPPIAAHPSEPGMPCSHIKPEIENLDNTKHFLVYSCSVFALNVEHLLIPRTACSLWLLMTKSPTTSVREEDDAVSLFPPTHEHCCMYYSFLRNLRIVLPFRYLCATRSFLRALSFASDSFLRMSTCLHE